jgi:hypothetical protein
MVHNIQRSPDARPRATNAACIKTRSGIGTSESAWPGTRRENESQYSDTVIQLPGLRKSVCSCIPIVIMLRDGSHDFKCSGIYLAYSRFILVIYKQELQGVCLVHSKYLPINLKSVDLVYTRYLPGIYFECNMTGI